MKLITFEPQIYTYDIDSGQHVSNISYIKWMEIGRIKLLEKVGMPVHEVEKLGFAPVLTRTEIAYKKPLYLGDKVRVQLYLTKLRRISGEIQFNFFNGLDELVAEGKQGALFFSLSTKRAYKLSEEQRSRFTPYLIEE
ncbi:MAG: thioesterase family protein [Gammaproteobacteria bacterium]|nr:MAG: thioesterase family protein [Gammaproteobacteria bacterium]